PTDEAVAFAIVKPLHFALNPIHEHPPVSFGPAVQLLSSGYRSPSALRASAAGFRAHGTFDLLAGLLYTATI
ncbi:MAG: hypothetical protein V3R60_00960, partial [Acidobacteriota bacterium]